MYLSVSSLFLYSVKNRMFSVWCQIFQNISDFTLFQFFLNIMLDFFPGKRQRKTSASVKCTLLSDKKKISGLDIFCSNSSSWLHFRKPQVANFKLSITFHLVLVPISPQGVFAWVVMVWAVVL